MILHKFPKRPAGTIIINDPDLPSETQSSTMQCCHCGKHWDVQVGSGKKRGWCTKCSGPTCGHPICMKYCYPQEKQHDDRESKNMKDYKFGEGLVAGYLLPPPQRPRDKVQIIIP